VIYPKDYYEKGVGVITVKHERYFPQAKTNNYIEGMKQTQIAKQTGAIEPVYYSDTQVFEACASNIFAVVDNKLITPGTHILPGITRGVLLEILQLDIPIEVRDFTRDELMDATEVFLTASGKEVVPVTVIDGKPVGNGAVGNISKEAMRQFREYTLSGQW
jgi:branched-subunit amino acid aminotransferase/4-amino-4-deoxychorismate lyase